MVTRRLYRLLLWTLLTLLPGLAHAGLFVFIEGVPGASKDAAHSQWIDVTTVSSSVGPAALKVAANSPSAELTMQEGLWSARLALYAVTATRVPRVVIEETAIIGPSSVVLSRMTLENVYIRSMKTQMSLRGTAQTFGAHGVELGYGRIKWDNWLYDANGSVLAAAKAGFDYERGTPQ